jgi:hypothetical protein
MDCNLYAVPGPYRQCTDCAEDNLNEWAGHPALFSPLTPVPRALCTACNVQESRATGPECLDCYFSPGGGFDRRTPAAKPVTPIPAPEDEMTYHPRYAKAVVTA